MTAYSVRVDVSQRPGIADPEGSTIERNLGALGFDGVSGVRVGKTFRFHVDAPDETIALQTAERLAERLLANPVIEDFHATVEGAPT